MKLTEETYEHDDGEYEQDNNDDFMDIGAYNVYHYEEVEESNEVEHLEYDKEIEDVTLQEIDFTCFDSDEAAS